MPYYKVVRTPKDGRPGKWIDASEDLSKMESLCLREGARDQESHYTVETVEGELPRDWEAIEAEDRRYR